MSAIGTIAVKGSRNVSGSLRVPGDKSISHRALILSALSDGETSIVGLSHGEDVRATRAALETLGVEIHGSEEVVVRGGTLREPDSPLDHGNSGTGMRLMAGVCASRDMLAVLTGDQYLRNRPMDRVAQPLRLMGASVDGRGDGRYAPLVVRGQSVLRGISYRSPVASAQVKSAVLLAGLAGDATWTVRRELATAISNGSKALTTRPPPLRTGLPVSSPGRA